MKVRLEGERLTWPDRPVPAKVTVCGLPLALSVMLTAAVRLPLAAGLNVMLIVQLPFGNTVPPLPQVVVSAKSPEVAPVMATLTPVKFAFPVFDRVTD